MNWLDELELLNAERTQGRYTLDACTPDDVIVWAMAPDPEESIYIGAIGDTDNSEAMRNARAICDAMNALPNLLRVARAAEAMRDARADYDLARARWVQSGRLDYLDGKGRADEALTKATEAVLAAVDEIRARGAKP